MLMHFRLNCFINVMLIAQITLGELKQKRISENIDAFFESSIDDLQDNFYDIPYVPWGDQNQASRSSDGDVYDTSTEADYPNMNEKDILLFGKEKLQDTTPALNDKINEKMNNLDKDLIELHHLLKVKSSIRAKLEKKRNLFGNNNNKYMYGHKTKRKNRPKLKNLFQSSGKSVTNKSQNILKPAPVEKTKDTNTTTTSKSTTATDVQADVPAETNQSRSASLSSVGANSNSAAVGAVSASSTSSAITSPPTTSLTTTSPPPTPPETPPEPPPSPNPVSFAGPPSSSLVEPSELATGAIGNQKSQSADSDSDCESRVPVISTDNKASDEKFNKKSEIDKKIFHKSKSAFLHHPPKTIETKETQPKNLLNQEQQQQEQNVLEDFKIGQLPATEKKLLELRQRQQDAILLKQQKELDLLKQLQAMESEKQLSQEIDNLQFKKNLQQLDSPNRPSPTLSILRNMGNLHKAYMPKTSIARIRSESRNWQKKFPFYKNKKMKMKLNRQVNKRTTNNQPQSTSSLGFTYHSTCSTNGKTNPRTMHLNSGLTATTAHPTTQNMRHQQFRNMKLKSNSKYTKPQPTMLMQKIRSGTNAIMQQQTAHPTTTLISSLVEEYNDLGKEQIKLHNELNNIEEFQKKLDKFPYPTLIPEEKISSSQKFNVFFDDYSKFQSPTTIHTNSAPIAASFLTDNTEEVTDEFFDYTDTNIFKAFSKLAQNIKRSTRSSRTKRDYTSNEEKPSEEDLKRKQHHCKYDLKFVNPTQFVHKFRSTNCLNRKIPKLTSTSLKTTDNFFHENSNSKVKKTRYRYDVTPTFFEETFIEPKIIKSREEIQHIQIHYNYETEIPEKIKISEGTTIHQALVEESYAEMAGDNDPCLNSDLVKQVLPDSDLFIPVTLYTKPIYINLPIYKRTVPFNDLNNEISIENYYLQQMYEPQDSPHATATVELSNKEISNHKLANPSKNAALTDKKNFDGTSNQKKYYDKNPYELRKNLLKETNGDIYNKQIQKYKEPLNELNKMIAEKNKEFDDNFHEENKNVETENSIDYSDNLSFGDNEESNTFKNDFETEHYNEETEDSEENTSNKEDLRESDIENNHFQSKINDEETDMEENEEDNLHEVDDEPDSNEYDNERTNKDKFDPETSVTKSNDQNDEPSDSNEAEVTLPFDYEYHKKNSQDKYNEMSVAEHNHHAMQGSGDLETVQHHRHNSKTGHNMKLNKQHNKQLVGMTSNTKYIEYTTESNEDNEKYNTQLEENNKNEAEENNKNKELHEAVVEDAKKLKFKDEDEEEKNDDKTLKDHKVVKSEDKENKQSENETPPKDREDKLPEKEPPLKGKKPKNETSSKRPQSKKPEKETPKVKDTKPNETRPHNTTETSKKYKEEENFHEVEVNDIRDAVFPHSLHLKDSEKQLDSIEKNDNTYQRFTNDEKHKFHNAVVEDVHNIIHEDSEKHEFQNKQHEKQVKQNENHQIKNSERNKNHEFKSGKENKFQKAQKHNDIHQLPETPEETAAKHKLKLKQFEESEVRRNDIDEHIKMHDGGNEELNHEVPCDNEILNPHESLDKEDAIDTEVHEHRPNTMLKSLSHEQDHKYEHSNEKFVKPHKHPTHLQESHSKNLKSNEQSKNDVKDGGFTDTEQKKNAKSFTRSGNHHTTVRLKEFEDAKIATMTHRNPGLVIHLPGKGHAGINVHLPINFVETTIFTTVTVQDKDETTEPLIEIATPFDEDITEASIRNEIESHNKTKKEPNVDDLYREIPVKREEIKLSTKCKASDYKNKNHCICSVHQMLKDLSDDIKDINASSKYVYDCTKFIRIEPGIVIGNTSQSIILRKKREFNMFEGFVLKKGCRVGRDINSLLLLDLKLKKNDVIYATVGSKIEIPCETKHNEQYDEFDSFAWTINGSPETAGIKENNGSTLLLNRVIPQDNNNYSCIHIFKNTTYEKRNSYIHHLSVVSIPMYSLLVTVVLNSSGECNPGDLEVLNLYYPVILNNLLCSDDDAVCSVSIEKPQCVRSGTENTISIHTTLTTSPLFTMMPKLNQKLCDLTCQSRVYSSIIGVLQQNFASVTNLPVFFRLSYRHVILIPIHYDRGDKTNTFSNSILTICPAGFGIYDNPKLCFACLAYTFNPGNEMKCLPCPTGSYQPSMGSASCLPCTSPLDDSSCFLPGSMADYSRKFCIIPIVTAILIILLICICCIQSKKRKNRDKNSKAETISTREPSVHETTRPSLRSRAGSVKKGFDRTKYKKIPPEPPPIDF